jgi:hypothetical protein
MSRMRIAERASDSGTLTTDGTSEPCPRPFSIQTVADVEAKDEFLQCISDLCRLSSVVAVEPHSGSPFSAVFLVSDQRVLIYERWSDALGMPTGELGVIDIDEIGAILVSY